MESSACEFRNRNAGSWASVNPVSVRPRTLGFLGALVKMLSLMLVKRFFWERPWVQDLLAVVLTAMRGVRGVR